ncbi:unnamed protein product [Durusdinium trenchii]|uniref:Uncharacterized protein n=1 Tax=Durusdinium trenchii TaxID=1381693 RepID=A0ABP0NSR6_9DINO
MSDRYPVQSYVLDVPSGTHGSRTVRLCYHKGDISFDLCCDERFGPTGNPDCWDSIDTFEECCSSAQWELLTTPWPREKIFHNAHLAVQLDRDPRWFSFPFRASSLCPDTTGPSSQARTAQMMAGMPELEFAAIAEQIRAALKEETANLWTHVREACSLSALVALTIFSAALQQRVSLASRDHLAMRVEEVWRQFQEALSEIFLQMKSEHALVDITGVPLLGSMEVILIWQSWMDLSFKDQELTELSLAEKVFQCAQGAYYATEDLYYSRLRPRLLEGCGAVCDVSLQTEGHSSFWVPQYLADVDCAALSGNRVISQPSRLRPAPRSVPHIFQEDFRRGGVVLWPRYEVPTVQSMEQRCRRWSKDSVEDLMRLVRQMGPEPLRWPAFDEFVAYDSEDLNSTARFLASLKDAMPLLGAALGGHWLVLGSLTPWIEAMLLEFGVASKVSTLEYANLSACPDRHPHLQPLLPEDFNAGYLSEERFDGFVQWSSVEHSGLGMYGDEINPWGDRQTVAQLWCRAKTGVAWFFFGPGPEGPGGTVFGRESHNENRSGRHSGSHFEEKLFWNAGRDYGREMMGRLMLNWKLVRPANSTWNFHVFQHREKKRLCSCGWVV